MISIIEPFDCVKLLVDITWSGAAGLRLRHFNGTFRAFVVMMTDSAVQWHRNSTAVQLLLVLLAVVSVVCFCCSMRAQQWWIADTLATNIYCVRCCLRRFRPNVSRSYRPVQLMFILPTARRFYGSCGGITWWTLITHNFFVRSFILAYSNRQHTH